MRVVKHQSVINNYMQKAGEPENDAGFELTLIRSHEKVLVDLDSRTVAMEVGTAKECVTTHLPNQ